MLNQETKNSSGFFKNVLNSIVNLSKRLFSSREFGIFIVLVVAVIFLAINTDTFMTKSNIAILSRQISLSAIIAIGMTMVILLGDIDLSVLVKERDVRTRGPGISGI